jgi:cellulose synthase (UDP-forming)
MYASEISLYAAASSLAALAFVCAAPGRRGWCRDLAVGGLWTTTLLYAWQRFAVLPAFDPCRVDSYWQWSFACTEGLALLYEVWSFFVIRRMSDHSREADQAEAAVNRLPAERLPSVAVFIPTCGEPPELVERTLESAAQLRTTYRGPLAVYCLDDDRFPRMPDASPPREAEETARAQRLRAKCEDLGIEYRGRPVRTGGKAGNLQFAFQDTTEDLIVVLDSDFHVDPHHFLPRTIGLLLRRPDVALVQVPQSFINPDPIAHNLRAPAAICDAQASFMRIVEAGRDHFGNAFCVGSGWVARRSALDEVGGFQRLATVCEDIELDYLLKSHGYRTVYLNEALSYGLAPESLPEFLGQQARWCFGTMQQLALPSGPIRGRHRLMDRLFYLDPPLFWLTHFATVQLLFAPILLWYFGIESIPDPHNQVLATMVPRLVVRALLAYWLSRGISLPLVSALPKTLAAFPVCAAILKWVFLNPRAAFRVTGKFEKRAGPIVRWPLFLTLGGITVLTLAGMLLGEFGMLSAAAMRYKTPLNYTWSLGAAAVCFLAAVVCVELPTPAIDCLSFHSVQKADVFGTVRGVIRRIASPE